MNKAHKQQNGFTLIEIMVVVVILAILASVIVPRIMGNPNKARVVKAKQDIRALESALDIYKLDNFNYPSTQDGLEALVQKPADASNWKAGGYIKKLSKDPWGHDYQYLAPSTPSGNVLITSLGADGVPGGTGINADISSDNIQ